LLPIINKKRNKYEKKRKKDFSKKYRTIPELITCEKLDDLRGTGSTEEPPNENGMDS